MPTSPPTILAVDDDHSVLGLLDSILSEAGYRVILANGGWDAIQAYEKSEERVNLLLTDVIMPDLTGPVVAERLRTRQPDLRVLFISGYSGMASPDIKNPNVGFLSKPFQASVLAARVREILNGSAGRDGLRS